MHTILLEEGYPLEFRETYLAMIKNSVGSKQYRELYVMTPKRPVDVIGNGDLACAFFTSSVLAIMGLLKGGVHTTVDETINDLEKSDWRRAEDPEEGAVLVWEAKLCSDHRQHKHIGFCVGPNLAISNDSESGTPILHHITFGAEEDGSPARRILAVYTHGKLYA